MIYLDYNATSPLKPEIASAMFNLAGMAYNPSSIHYFGRNAKNIIEIARKQIAKAVKIKNIDEWQIIFTSSGTEANNQIVHSYKDHIVITSCTEHLSILKTITDYPNVKILPVNEAGQINLDALKEALSLDGTKLVSIIYANNETGIIQNIKEIAEIVHSYGAIMHSDAVQAVGRIAIDIEDLKVDALTISAHKCGGPIGVGCLIIRKKIFIKSLINGGGQEQNLRAGTENVCAIMGFGMICDDLDNILLQADKVKKLRDYLEQQILSYCKRAFIVGKDCYRLNNTISLILPISAETMLINLDLAGFAISTGSACSSGRITSSYVLKNMGFAENIAKNAIRISLSINNNIQQIEQFITSFKQIYDRLTTKKIEIAA